MPIFLAPLGEKLRVVRIATDDKLRKHLESLGITVNCELSIISSTGGNVVLMVKDGRLALDRDIASKIFVA